VTAFLPLAQAEWGTVPDWVAAFGTLAAFFVALRLLAKELVARREQEQDRRRPQARLANAWLAFEAPPDSDRDTAVRFTWQPRKPPPPQRKAYIIAKNDSGEPVHRVRVSVVHKDSPLARDPEAAFGQTESYYIALFWDVLPPLRTASEKLPDYVFPNWHVPVALSFTDSQGRRWKRLPDGTLTEITKRPRRSRKDYMNAWIAGELDHLDY
jgi:hypothetical protein